MILLLCAFGGLAYVISALVSANKELDVLNKKLNEQNVIIPAEGTSKIPIPEDSKTGKDNGDVE